jgi:hypothetical protein
MCREAAMNNKLVQSMALSAFTGMLVLLTGCGGGGGGDDGDVGDVAGIGGTGFILAGPIDGFGSIFVNGIEIETDSSEIDLDGQSGSEDDLRLGMYVVVTGTVDDSGQRSTASLVSYDDDLQGPISAIIENSAGDEKTLTILGVQVTVDKLVTVFDDVSYDSLLVGDLVEVSGYVQSTDTIRATRIEKKENFVSGVSEIELKGSVTGLTGTTFTVNSFTVDASSADLSDLPGATLRNGQFVEVKGTLSGNTIVATRIELEDDDFADTDNFSIEGIVSDFSSNASFKVAGTQVDASNAVFTPAGLNIANGMEVQAEGSIVNGVLVADRVESRDSEVRISARVSSVSMTSSSITLDLVNGAVTVKVDNSTRMKDSTDAVEVLTLGDISAGDYLEVAAEPQTLVASEIERDEADDVELRGSVDSFVVDSSITILGVSYSVVGADFEGINDNPLSSSQFFSQLAVGDIVGIKDEEPADGLADEVEFED